MAQPKEKAHFHEFTFPVILEHKKNGGYVVTNPTIDGCYSQGDTLEEALENIKEATALCLEAMAQKSDIFQPKNISLHFIQFPIPYAKASHTFRKRSHQKTL